MSGAYIAVRRSSASVAGTVSSSTPHNGWARCTHCTAASGDGVRVPITTASTWSSRQPRSSGSATERQDGSPTASTSVVSSSGVTATSNSVPIGPQVPSSGTSSSARPAQVRRMSVVGLIT